MTDSELALPEGFAGELLTVLNHGALSLMVSIGHRTGLFDAMGGLAPSTSAEIARAAGLQERYVREWLGAMVTGGFVEVDDASRLYRLAPDRAAVLTRSAGADNLASFAQYVAMLGAVEDDIVHCFRAGGGVPYERFPRLQEVMAEGSAEAATASLESHVLPLVPSLSARLARGIRVLDVGCGSGRILTRLATLFPASQFVGLDFSEDAVRRAAGAAAGLPNCEFHVRDLADFDAWAPAESYEWITAFDAVHDHPRPLALLRGIHQALTDDGLFLMQEIKGSSYVRHNVGHPLGTMLYTISTMHCMTVSLAQGGEGLGAMWGEEKARHYLAEAGFTSVIKHQIATDLQNDWYVVLK